jgi:hypothetical protein
MMILWEHRDKLQALIVMALAIIAYRRGAGPERLSSAVLVLMIAAMWLYQLLRPAPTERAVLGYGTIHPYFLAVDVTAFAALATIALHANRFYPILLAGCQLVSTMTHLASSLLRTAFPFAYALFNILPFYCMIAVLAAGLLAHLRRVRRVGPYPSWRGRSGPSRPLTQRPPPPPMP